MDANFRLRCKERGIDDLELGSGWGFYVEESGYLRHVARFAKQKEVRHTRVSDLVYIILMRVSYRIIHVE